MNTLNANKLKEMFLGGEQKIAEEFEYINELNVFPVPDGDTGSNMKITITGACDVIRNQEYKSLGDLGKQFSRGLLMNARGNSGVIFSQIIKGLTSVFDENTKEVYPPILINAFMKAKETAYRAVTMPVEGTILTVIRVTAENLNKKRSHFKTIEEVMTAACKEAENILAKTPEFLQELKEVGVVDSGGYGLCRFLEGMLSALTTKKRKKNEVVVKAALPKHNFIDNFRDNNDGFGYCCEFIMLLKSKVALSQKNKDDFDLSTFKKALSKIGNSLAVVVDEKIVKVHVHSLTPYNVLEIGADYGEFSKVKIENMTLQFLERNPGTTLETVSQNFNDSKLSKDIEIIATVPSTRIADIYVKELNVKYLINTEINGNPSISEFVAKIRETNSSNIIIVIDDSNILMAVNEAIKLVPKHISIKLVNAHDVAASYVSCLAFDPILSLDKNFDNIVDIIERINVGKISMASKMVSYSHIEVAKGDCIGVFDKKIITSSKNVFDTAKHLIDKLVDETKKAKIAYVICGRGAQLRDIRLIRKHLVEAHGLKTFFISGDQPVYNYYIAVKAK
jgi:DAK2 domain fusion protein YloV